MKRFVVYAVLVVCCLGCSKEDAFLKIDRTKLSWEMDALGGEISVPVNSNYAFTVNSDSGWCSAVIRGQSVRITVSPLEDAGDRTASVLIESDGCSPVTVTVVQKAVSTDEIEFFADSGTGTFVLPFVSAVPVSFDLPEWMSEADGNVWEWGENSWTFVLEPYAGEEVSRKGEVVLRTDGGSLCTVTVEQSLYANKAVQNLYRLWQTDPMSPDEERIDLLQTMQDYTDMLPPDEFKAYLDASDDVAEEMEQEYAALSCYSHAYSHVLDGLKYDTVEDGSVAVWLLYNMGFVVKTSSAAFGIDLNHRMAAGFAPYLDFLCVTHNHSDHTATELMQAMANAGKPVLSNFWQGSSSYCSTVPTNYVIGDFRITTAITDHNEELRNFITVFRIECGQDAGGFSFMHCGDSSFDESQFGNVEGGDLDMLVLRHGGSVENNILGTGQGQVSPEYALLSHVVELRHQIGESPIRFPLTDTLDNVENIRCDRTYMPFWGEKLVWKKGEGLVR